MAVVKISIIMLVCNVQKFFKKSINNVLNQIFKDFKLLLIDDGSWKNTLSKKL